MPIMKNQFAPVELSKRELLILSFILKNDKEINLNRVFTIESIEQCENLINLNIKYVSMEDGKEDESDVLNNIDIDIIFNNIEEELSINKGFSLAYSKTPDSLHNVAIAKENDILHSLKNNSKLVVYIKAYNWAFQLDEVFDNKDEQNATTEKLLEVKQTFYNAVYNRLDINKRPALEKVFNDEEDEITIEIVHDSLLIRNNFHKITWDLSDLNEIDDERVEQFIDQILDPYFVRNECCKYIDDISYYLKNGMYVSHSSLLRLKSILARIHKYINNF